MLIAACCVLMLSLTVAFRLRTRTSRRGPYAYVVSLSDSRLLLAGSFVRSFPHGGDFFGLLLYGKKRDCFGEGDKAPLPALFYKIGRAPTSPLARSLPPGGSGPFVIMVVVIIAPIYLKPPTHTSGAPKGGFGPACVHAAAPNSWPPREACCGRACVVPCVYVCVCPNAYGGEMMLNAIQ